jgi:uncharacterized protein (TIGR02145 family)
MRFNYLLFSVLCMLIVLSSCRKNIPVEITIESGNAQLSPLNAELGEPLVIKAVNFKGEAIEGVEVTFLVKSGEGSFVGGDYQFVDTTDAEGLASARWVFGPERFVQQVEAHVKRYNGEPLVFYASPEYFKDNRDGQTYLLVQMGSNVWMGQNMRYNSPASLANPNYPNTEYGRLYPWTDLATVCPTGFHVPAISEWTDLILATGNDDNIGRKIKSLTGWGIGGNGRNLTGFNIFPAGNYILEDNINEYRGYQEYAAFWTSEEDSTNTNRAYYRIIDEAGTNIALSKYDKSNRTSCRCVRD